MLVQNWSLIGNKGKILRAFFVAKGVLLFRLA